jgi:hypothetical protein
MENKVVITDSEREINEFLKHGWTVKSVTPQIVATNSLESKFCFVLERPI